jgi:nucleoid DNA-binding protein
VTTTKEDIVRDLMIKTSLNQPSAKKHIEKLLQIIKETLGSGSILMISSFGIFRISHKSARIGRDPKTKVA